MRPLVSSWPELAPDREALDSDPWYRLLGTALFIAFAAWLSHALLVSPKLVVDVAVSPALEGRSLEATATPLSVERADARPSSRRRTAWCRVTAGSCKLLFRWDRRAKPYFWEKHTVRLNLCAGGERRPLGKVQVKAPRWDVVPVLCDPAMGCRAAEAS